MPRLAYHATLMIFVMFLRDKPIERLQAAREALRDFKADGLKLTGLSNNIERALERLFQ